MNKVWVFQEATLKAALVAWVDEQIAGYPHREEVIRTVAVAMRSFLESRQAVEHKMVMETPDRTAA